MVDSVGKQNVNLSIKGSKAKLNTKNLNGTLITKDTPIFMKKYDKNGDGVITNEEAEVLLADLKKAAGNNTLSAREFEKAGFGNKSEFEKLKTSADTKSGKTTIQNGDVTTTVTKNDDGSFSRVTHNSKKEITVASNYDANGRVVSQNIKTSSSSVSTAYNYDKAGNLIGTEQVKKNEKSQVTQRTKESISYDEYGHKIGTKRNVYAANGKLATSTTIRFENDAAGNPVKITGATTNADGKVMAKKVETRQYKNGKLASAKVSSSTTTSSSVTSKTYAADGKTPISVVNDTKNKDGSSAHTEQTFNKSGKIATQHNIQKAKTGDVVSDTTAKFEYAADGKTPKKQTEIGTKENKPYNKVSNFDEKGKLKSIDTSYYKRGAKVEEHYEGANLENRKGLVPSKQIAYNKDGSVKEITINKFDKDGVLIGSEIQDKNGKTIATHDFTAVDGNFDTSYQKGRGDCYLLAGLNSLRESSQGREDLKKIITTGKDPKTGETTYTVTLPGAKKVREKLLAAGVPEKDINIKESYTYTESQLHEKAKLAGPKYSTGDKDVLLLEVSYEQYRTDAKNDKADLKKAKPNMSDRDLEVALHVRGVNKDNLSGGQGGDAVFMLTGRETQEYQRTPNSNSTDNAVCSIDSNLNMSVVGGFKVDKKQSQQMDSMLNKIEQDCKDGKLDNYSATVGFKVSSQTVNGKVIVGGGHAFSISKVEGDKVYLRNPWDPTKEIVMTRDEVKKAATSVTLTPLNSGTSGNTAGVGGNGGSTPAVSGSGAGNNGGNGASSVSGNSAPVAGQSFKVPAGKGYRTLLAEALTAQGIDPTPENIEKASKQFKAANKGAVQIYKGSNAKYRGNEFLYQDAVVVIPKFQV